MLISDFDFDLPEELIASYPLEKRDQSRLLHYNLESNSIQHKKFQDISQILNSGDILVRNVSRVLAARLYLYNPEKYTNKPLEVLLIKELNPLTHQNLQYKVSKKEEISINQSKFKTRCHTKGLTRDSEEGYSDEQTNHTTTKWSVLAKPAKKIKEEPCTYVLKSGEPVKVYRLKSANDKSEDDFIIEFKDESQFRKAIEECGQMPIPPYFKRGAEALDKDRYQTIYAQKNQTGKSVAAPTAGLHFTDEVINNLKNNGIEFIDLNLDVGIGTFKPVSTEKVADHKMHAENYEIASYDWERIQKAKAEGKRIISIGTTSLRCLESIIRSGNIKGSTDIYIYPENFEFKIIDGLLTNFHLPKSTLILLVSALMGIKECKEMYEAAIKERYRFFSYGDCSLIL